MGDSTISSALPATFGTGESAAGDKAHLGLPTGRVKRITMFKIPSLQNQQALVDAYKVLETKAAKNDEGKSYILSIDSGIIEDPARGKGYTVIGITEFNSLEDMRYYDEKCQEHAALKEKARELGVEEPPLVAYWQVRIDPADEGVEA